MHSFGEIKELDIVFQNQFHYTIDVTRLDTLAKKRHYFKTIEEANAWRAWAKAITEKPPPKGITIDLRNPARPYFARFKVPGRRGQRYSRYFATEAEAVRWLNIRKSQVAT